MFSPSKSRLRLDGIINTMQISDGHFEGEYFLTFQTFKIVPTECLHYRLRVLNGNLGGEYLFTSNSPKIQILTGRETVIKIVQMWDRHSEPGLN